MTSGAGATHDDETARVLSILRRHGTQTTSFQVLEPGYRYWFDDDDACVAYTETGRAWVVAGEPVAARERLRSVTERFVAAAAARGAEVRFFGVGEDFAALTGLHSVHIGEEPRWDPRSWDATLRGSRSLREQLRRARAKGVRARVVAPAELAPGAPLRIRAEALISRWLDARRMSEMQFMVLVHPFDFPDERRYVVAEQGDALVGFVAAVPIYARDGWFVEDLLRHPDAPNGTAELLVDTMMRQLDAEGSRLVSLGLAPLAGEVGMALRWTRSYTASLYNFGGVRAFKEKLRPERWEPVHLAFPKGRFGWRALRDVLTAFAPGGLLRFGLNTLVHERTLATGMLALLLVPWTLLLAWVPTEPWFPSPQVQWAWVAFDLVLIVLLFSLVRRWRARLATALAVLISVDAVLTCLQVLLHNVAATPFGWRWAFIALGVTGPLLAATFFWATRIVAVRAKRPLASPPAPPRTGP